MQAKLIETVLGGRGDRRRGSTAADDWLLDQLLSAMVSLPQDLEQAFFVPDGHTKPVTAARAFSFVAVRASERLHPHP